MVFVTFVLSTNFSFNLAIHWYVIVEAAVERKKRNPNIELLFFLSSIPARNLDKFLIVENGCRVRAKFTFHQFKLFA